MIKTPRRTKAGSLLQDRRIAVNSLIVISAFGLDKVLALLRDVVIGRQFGAGFEYDAYSAAIQGPELLFTLIAGGALLAAAFGEVEQDAGGRTA